MPNIDDILSGADDDEFLKGLTPVERAVYDSMIGELLANGGDSADMRLFRKSDVQDYLALRCQKCGGTRGAIPGSTVQYLVKCGTCGETSFIRPD